MNTLHTVGAAAPGLAAPEPAEKEEARQRGDAAGLSTGKSTPDSTEAERKRLATAQARAALQGAVLVQIEDDSGQPVYILSRGAWLREFTQLLAVENVLQRMEGRP